jgi:ABC-type Fe3+-siderophore transport system permease subunit
MHGVEACTNIASLSLNKKTPAFALGQNMKGRRLLSILLSALLTALLSALTGLLARLLILLIGLLLATAALLVTLAALLILFIVLVLILRHFKLHHIERALATIPLTAGTFLGKVWNPEDYVSFDIYSVVESRPRNPELLCVSLGHLMVANHYRALAESAERSLHAAWERRFPRMLTA